jgi:hypothetical protein
VRTTTVDTLEKFSAEQFFGKFFRARPVLIPNQLTHWPAIRVWSPSYLKKQFGRATIKVSLYDPDLPQTFFDQTISFVHRAMTLSDFIDSFQESPDSRFALREDNTLFAQFPEMFSDLVCFSPFCSMKSAYSLKYKSLWLGSANYTTGLHCDPGDTLLFQIFGHKRVLLYEPGQSKYLYQETARAVQDRASQKTHTSAFDESYVKVLIEEVGWCEVDPFNIDLAKFPLFTHTTGVEALLVPGDTLYIPDKWWHAVRSIDPTISVSIQPTFDGPLFVIEPNETASDVRYC